METVSLTYMHAMRNPYTRRIAKPFERREVTGEVEFEFDPEFQEWMCRITVGGRKFWGDSAPTQQEAFDASAFDAQYTLMDESREPWRHLAFDRFGRYCSALQRP